MPELPEVETIKRGLSKLLPGKRIAGVWYDWEKSFPNAPGDVNEFLIGALVTSVRRRAKVLLIDLDTHYTLVIHLKMTGQLVYIRTQELVADSDQLSIKTDGGRQAADNRLSSPEERFGAGHPNDSLIGELPDRSTRVIFDFEDDSKLFFNDQRKFGWIRLMPSAEVQNIDFFRRAGPEPLSPDFTRNEFRERVGRRANTNIKAALLDQSVIAGIGNIYADESLWGASIHPNTLVKDIPAHKLNELFTEIQTVLRRSIEKGGSTDKNYINAEGKRGRYLDFANVFRREGLPCPRCAAVINKIRVAGRGTHLCPRCQKKL